MTTKTVMRTDWILASASPRRCEILSSLGLKYRLDPSLLPEPAPNHGETPWGYAVRVAQIKAREIGTRHRSGLVIGADTIVVAGNHIMGKPSSDEDARSMLRRLSGRWHEVITGVCLLDCRLRRSRSAYARSRVHFRRISPEEIDWYIRTGEHRDKAGAYAIQGYASLFIDRIEGCYFNIVGFPAATFERLCRKLGVDLKRQLSPQGQKVRASQSAVNPPEPSG
jgi:septum formation protein